VGAPDTNDVDLFSKLIGDHFVGYECYALALREIASFVESEGSGNSTESRHCMHSSIG